MRKPAESDLYLLSPPCWKCGDKHAQDKLMRWKLYVRWLLAAVVSGHLWGVVSAPSVDTIIQRSVAANDRDWLAAPDFSYLETDHSHGGSRTYRVSMIMGSPYRELVRINGKALSPAAQARQQHKLDQITARRRNESPSQRAHRVAAYRTGRERDHQMLSQLTKAFNFRLTGTQSLGSRSVYVLDASPRPGYVPPTRDTRVLPGMRGTLWVDTQTFQWVKVEAQVVHPVWIAGFVARVDPGTRFALDYAPVTAGIWLPTRYQMTARAKVLMIFSHNGQADQTFSDYQKAPAPAQ